MSIVRLVRVTFLGHADDKATVLVELQELGCLHLVPFRSQGAGPPGQGPSAESREALKFLLACRHRRHQVTDRARFDAELVERRALEIQRRLGTLEDERDFLVRRIADLRPWGDFALPALDDVAGLRLWFYVVPHYEMAKVEASELCWQTVHRDNRFCYVVVLSGTEPESGRMPVLRTRTGSKSLGELQWRLSDVELEIEDLQAERASLTRWCLLFAESLDLLEDRAALAAAARQTCDVEPLFALEAWAPESQVARLEEYAGRHGMVLETRRPDRSDDPPTLLQNPRPTAAGQDLVTFYMTPGYWTWDPSSVVLVSFAIFFAMILSDAGYAAVLGLVLLLSRRRLGRSEIGRRLAVVGAAVTGASVAYGVIAGSYFGVSPPSGSVLARLDVLDVTDAPTMMALSILIGATHVALGNLMEARRLGRQPAALAPLGWVLITAGGIGAWSAWDGERAWMTGLAAALLVGGVALVFAFSGVGARPLVRLGTGLLALTRVTSAFGDVLSYLRLFALGLATTALAVAFNDLAAAARSARPGLGLLFALLVLLVGHALNLTLGLMSGVVHGLRLNVIEFFNWSLKEEGRLYRPFKRKESAPWNP